jgi:hypothetical protein
MIPKHYDPNGSAKVHFGIGNEKQVFEFTGKDASEFEIINHSLLKKAYVVPCEIDYQISREEEL